LTRATALAFEPIRLRAVSIAVPRVTSSSPFLESMPPACPACTLEDVLSHPDLWECATCGHEWPKEAAPAAARVVKDAHGNPLADGDTVALIKDLKLRGSSQVLKQGTKAKNIRLVEGDHEIDCKIDGSAMALKACFVKKA
jgi:protein PhnA